MSRNGSGTYTLPAGNPVVTGTTITSSWANTTMQNIADALTQSVSSDGQTPMSGPLNMASNNINNVATLNASDCAITTGVFTTLTSPSSTPLTIQSGSITAVTINTSQQVGINKTNPAYPLDVSGTINSGALIANNVTANVGNVYINRATANSSIAYGTTQFQIDGGTQYSLSTPSGYTLAFLAGGTVEKMRIDGNGNLMVNTTSPTSKLTVAGTIEASGANYIYSRANAQSPTDAGGLEFKIDGTTYGRFYQYAQNQFSLAGTINIGGTSTTANLRISKANTDGLYMQQGFTDGVERLRIENNGNITNSNNSYGSLSDIKLKENIEPATPKLDDLLKVKVCSYNFKKELGYDGEKQLGVIAQELEAIFPSLITESEDADVDGNKLGTTTKSVKYSVFVPMLIKAIQELNAKIEKLEGK
jgi:hypothetical protein